MSPVAPPFRSVHAAHLSWQECVEEIVDRLLAAPLAPTDAHTETLGFLFLGNTLHQEAERILTILQQRTGIRRWAGTVANGIMSMDHDYRLEPAIAAMVGTFPRGSTRVFSTMDPLPGRHSGMPSPWWTALVYGDGRHADVMSQLEQTAAQVRSGFLFGGLTEGGAEQPLPAFAGERVLRQRSLAGVAFRDDVAVQVRMAQAFKPLGGVHQITEAHDNIIVELDGQRALDVLDEEFFEHHPLPLPPNVTLAELPAVLVDMGVYRTAHAAMSGNNRQDMGQLADFDLSVVEDIDPSGGRLIMTVDVQTDTRLRFCVPDATAAHHDLQQMLTRLQEDIAARNLSIRGGIYISDTARGRTMFREPGAELRMIRNTLGDFPLIGYYSEGEIQREVRHTQAGLLTLFTAESD